MAEVNKGNLKLIVRLIESGITTEKAVSSLKLKDILSIPNLSKTELTAICQLQEAIKAGSLFSFLTLPEKKEKGSLEDET